MDTKPYCRLVMLGGAADTRGGMSSVVDAYREHGLFKRWPIDYLATHGGGGARRNASLALSALRRFIALLVHEPGIMVHVHATPERGFWRDALFMALAIATRCPFILHLHGAGFDRLHDGAGRA